MNTPHPTAPNPIRTQKAPWEWPTLGLLVLCCGLWAGAVFWLSSVSMLAAAVALVVALVLHSSLSHEVLHGHPFASRGAGTALMIVQPGLFIPYIRFRDTHLAHHMDARLTDPYDDPESNYLDPAVWENLPWASKTVLRANNTLLGRMVLGPLVSQWAFMRADTQQILQGDRAVQVAWALHLPGVALTIWAVHHAGMSLWLYLFCAYAALSVLKIRTFLEHQAHVRSSGRSVIVEDRGILAFLFLNNNLHIVHHMHPRVAWYNLPALYWGNKNRYLSRNGGYVYRSYREIFRRYFWKSKDTVAHPLWPMR